MNYTERPCLAARLAARSQSIMPSEIWVGEFSYTNSMPLNTMVTFPEARNESLAEEQA